VTRFAQRFVLEREIGAGGMARVFLGRDEVLDRPVAVKILRFRHTDSDVGARFSREGRTAARLSHPNIVQVYDAGEGEFEGQNASYIVMEYVSGGDLSKLINDRGTIPPDDLVKLGEAVASGLAHAHERGIIHRDIKPHNILIDENGRPKLTDFGIARALDATTSNHTRTGAYLGTALYSAPEQLQGEKVTPKSDIYSLGATLYQAATGKPPFSGTPISVANQHVSKPPPSPRELNAAIGGELEDLILACLAKDPDDRPTAEELRSRLAGFDAGAAKTKVYAGPATQPTQRVQEEPTRAASPGTGNQSRTRILLAALALLLIFAAVAAIALPNLFGGGGESKQTGSQHSPQKPNKPSGNGQDKNNQSSAQTTTASEPTTENTQPARKQTKEPPKEKTAEKTQPDGLTAQAAEQTIRDHYAVAASDNYQNSWTFLSSRYQQQIGSPEAWTNQFQDLKSVQFTSGPTAQVNGNTATVTFSTVAVHADHTDQPNVTATLINENGKWKIDNLNVS